MARLKSGFWRRPGGFVFTRDPVTGKRVSTRTRDPKAAELWRAERDRLAANPAYAASLTASVGEWVRKTMAYKASTRSAGTLDMYRKKLGHFVRVWGEHRALADITPGLVDDYVAQRAREGVVNNTIARELTCLRQMLRLAKRAAAFSGDLEALMPVGFSADYTPVTRVLNIADLPRLMAALRNDTERAWVALALSTGADVGDIERARPEDYDAERSMFRVRGTKTGTRDAWVPILPHMRELFDFAHSQLPVSWPRASKGVGEACKRAGIPHLSPKDLRRTAGMLLAAAGADISLVGRYLRHKSDAMARKVYTPLQGDQLGALLLPASSSIASRSEQNDPKAPWRKGRRRGFKRRSGDVAPIEKSHIAAELTAAHWRAVSRTVGIISANASRLARAAVGFVNRRSRVQISKLAPEQQTRPGVTPGKWPGEVQLAGPGPRASQDSPDATLGIGERHPGKARTLDADGSHGAQGDPATAPNSGCETAAARTYYSPEFLAAQAAEYEWRMGL